MKRLFSFLAVILLINCSQDLLSPPTNGAVPKGSAPRAAESASIAMIDCFLSNGRETIKFEMFPGDYSAQRTIKVQKAGKWSLQVFAYSSDKQLRYTALRNVRIFPDEITQLRLVLREKQIAPDVSDRLELRLDEESESQSKVSRRVNSNTKKEGPEINGIESDGGTMQQGLNLKLFWDVFKFEALFTHHISLSSGDGPIGINHADLDHDDDLDLMVANYFDNTLSVYLNSGTGEFEAITPIACGVRPVQMLAHNWSEAAMMDIIVCDYDQNYPGITSLSYDSDQAQYLHSGFLPLDIAPHRLVKTDVDAEGKIDIVTSIRNNGKFVILKNMENTHFRVDSTYTLLAGMASDILSVDFNGDGMEDLAVSSTGVGMVDIYMNNGFGEYSLQQNVYVGGTPWYLKANDFDDDGLIDLAVAMRYSDSIKLLRNMGDGVFVEHTSIATRPEPYSFGVADLDGDGFEDLVTVGQTSGVIEFHKGDGNFLFQNPFVYELESGLRFITIADFNGDDRRDVAVTNHQTNSVVVLFNTLPE